MTTGRTNSAHAFGAGKLRQSQVVLENTALGAREKSHGDKHRGTGNIANAEIKERGSASKTFFGNHKR